jgi:hypothetical protein
LAAAPGWPPPDQLRESGLRPAWGRGARGALRVRARPPLSSYSIAAEFGCRATTVSRALPPRHRGGMGRPAAVAPGQIYGRLTVLRELPERSRGGRVFRCLYACGRETEARAVELRKGKIRSCGCLRDETRPSGQTPPPSVHSGQHDGRLIDLHRGGRESPSDARMFSCGCDCGSPTTVGGANLTRGHTRSCRPARRRRTSLRYPGRWQ